MLLLLLLLLLPCTSTSEPSFLVVTGVGWLLQWGILYGEERVMCFFVGVCSDTWLFNLCLIRRGKPFLYT